VFRLRSGILIASKALGKRIPAETSSAILLTGDHLALLTDKGPEERDFDDAARLPRSIQRTGCDAGP
jgi:hypothetical protein